jgi:hypothetical protein
MDWNAIGREDSRLGTMGVALPEGVALFVFTIETL